MSTKDVHIYLSRTSNLLNADRQQLVDTYLSAAERDAALLITDKSKKDGFIHAHAFKRFLLSKHLQMLPQEMEFVTNSYGKPFIANMPESKQFYFNLSYTDGLTAIIIGPWPDIGIDVEIMKDRDDFELIQQVIFSDVEKEEAKGIPDANAVKENFYQKWVVKESFLKAIGTGLSIEPSYLTVENSDNTFKIITSSWCSAETIVILYRKIETVALAYALPVSEEGEPPVNFHSFDYKDGNFVLAGISF